MASGEQSGSWWAASFAAALPAAGLAAAGGAVGLGAGAGLALVGAAVAYLAADLTVIQPRIDARLLGGRSAGSPSLATGARDFLTRALALRDVREIARELEVACRAALGIERTLVVVPAPTGGVQVLGGSGLETGRLGDAEAAFLWLGDRGEPVDRAALAQLREFDGARATDEMLARLGADVVLPLRHRGLLLGVIALSAPTRTPEGAAANLGMFFRTLGAHATMAIANTYLGEEARGKGSLAKAFDLATAIQEALMPEDRPIKRAGVTLRGVYRPVAECGGDLWAYQDLGKGRLLLLVGDATGHGAAPAMLTAVAKGTIEAVRQVAGAELDPGQLLVSLNHAIFRAGRTRYLMTAFAAVIDSVDLEVRYANAGQNFPYVITRGEGGKPKIEALVARGNTLGAAHEAPYQTHKRRFAPGERLILYTDGVVDAGTPAFEPFGEKRFRNILMAHADTSAARIPEAILAEVDAYLAGRPFADDITVAAAEITPREEERSSPGGIPL